MSSLGIKKVFTMCVLNVTLGRFCKFRVNVNGKRQKSESYTTSRFSIREVPFLTSVRVRRRNYVSMQ